MKKRFLCLIVSFALVISLLSGLTLVSYADGSWGDYRLWNGSSWGSWTAMNSLSNVRTALETTAKNSVMEVRMNADWSWNGDRFTIDSTSDITIRMHGHMIQQTASAGRYKGVFVLKRSGNSSAKVTLIGYDEEDITNAGSLEAFLNANQHSVTCYTGTGGSTGTKTIRGALVTGGNVKTEWTTTFGGGFDLEMNTELTLQHVTVAGNKSTEYGGAIRAMNDGVSITMDDAHIEWNYAGYHGGGIRIAGDNCVIKMTNGSTINYNYAGRNGGGVQGDNPFTLEGDGTCSVSYNECAGNVNSNSVGGGGGIDVYAGASVIKNLIIEHNKTNSYQGGGILVEGEKGTAISGCTIRYNTATGSSGAGGGVYFKHSTSSLADCEIQYNTAYNRQGDGVYLRDGGTGLGGLLNIGDNGIMNGTTLTTPGTNLYLASGAYINPSLNNTSKIGVTVANASTSRRLSENAGTYSPYCYTYDNNDAYGFKWYNEDPSAGSTVYRHLYLVAAQNADREPVPVTSVGQQTIAVDTVIECGTYSVNGTDYPLVKTWFSDLSAADTTSDYDAVCFYSDGYFMEDPDTYNEHLATLSHCLTMAGFTAHLGNEGTDFYDPDAYSETNGTRYNIKHAHVRQLLANIGCPEECFFANQYSLEKPGTDSIGVAISSKELPDGTYLIPVVVRGADYEAEWASNFTLNGSGEAGGFSDAATKTRSAIETYLDRHELRPAAQSGLVKFWVVGYSRAGATANLTAKRLVEDYANSEIFCYTFEAAQGGVDAAETRSADSYYCIHNIVNAADAVPMVAPTEMGFKRYGVDHYVPGTAAGNVTSSTQTVTRGETASIAVTTYTDNQPIYVDSADYLILRTKMLPQYRAFNPHVVFDDYYSRAEINWTGLANIPILTQPFNQPVSSSQKVEAYLVELMATLQSWKIEGRAWFTEDYVLRGSDTKTTTYEKSFQGALRDVFRMLFSRTPAESDAIIEDVKSVMNGVGVFGSYIGAGDLLDLYNNVIQGWHTKTHDYKVEKLDWVWGILQKTGVFEHFSAEEIADLEQDWPILGDTILTLLSKDYQYGDRQVLGTLLYNYQRILLNHYAETVMAWLRASDSYYDDETDFYRITLPQTPDAPAGSAEGLRAQTLASDEMNYCYGAQTVHLNVEQLQGEAIFFTVSDGTDTTEETVYFDGIKLAAPGENELPILYTVEAYAVSHGRRSDPVRYQVTVRNPICMVGYSLSLEGDILVNAYLSIPEGYDDAVVTLSTTDSDGNTTTLSTAAAQAAQNSSGQSRFSLGVPAKNMNDTITLTVTEDGTELPIYAADALYDSIAYSVQSYLQQTLRMTPSPAQGSKAEKMNALCRAMSDYGYAAQLHFDYDVNTFPKTDPSQAAYAWYNADAIAAVAAETAYKPVISEGSGAKFFGASLLTLSETTIRLYFRLPNAASYAVSVSDNDGVMNGRTQPALQQYETSRYYYVDLAGVPAKNLGTAFTVTLTNNNDASDAVTVENYSAFSYVWQVLSDPDANGATTVRLARTIKLYGDAAATYFAAR